MVRCARLSQVVQHLPHGDARDRIEAGGRLVEKEDLRIVHQAARNLHPAAHSAGERLDLRAAPLGQVNGFQHFVDVLLALGPGHAVELGVDAQVLFDGEVGIAGERLGNHADHAPHRIRFLGHIVAGDDRFAAGDRNQRGHHADQRALACAVRPQQAEDFAVGHREAHVLDRFKVAIALDDRSPPRSPALGLSAPVAPVCTAAHCFTSLFLGM